MPISLIPWAETDLILREFPRFTAEQRAIGSVSVTQ
jgi:hypothetical protein